MTDTMEATVVDVDLTLEAADEEECVADFCGRQALWVTEWSCSCALAVCQLHKDSSVEGDADPGLDCWCSPHGAHWLTLLAVNPIGRR